MSQIMKNDEINTYKIDVYDTEKFQDTFVEWFSQFKENVYWFSVNWNFPFFELE